MARLSLAQQIADLDAPAPVDADPEAFDVDPQISSSDVSRAHYVDFGRSNLRKLHDSVADPKYDGVKVSRKQLMEDEEESLGSSNEDIEGVADEEGEEKDEEDGEDDRQDDDPSSEGEKEEGDEEDEDAEMDGEAIANDHVKEAEDITSSLRKTQDEDRKKGVAVSRQMGISDNLLDARIRMQKCVTSSNMLPSSSRLPNDEPEVQEALSRMLTEAVLLSEQIFELQETLLKADSSVSPPARKRRKIESGVEDSDLKSYIAEACADASALEQTYHPHLVQTLSKWSSKIQAVAPSVLLPSNRNAFSKDRQHLKTAVQLVDENLSTHDKLLSRTQQWRGKGSRLGVETQDGEAPEKDVEIFDDTDFYQQLLRDVIDARDASGADDWMVVQKQKKAKKKVDTKASKGRKLRYEVHEKLQNFMAPMHVKGSWHEEQIDELFASLLGKGFEDAINAQVDDMFAERRVDLDEASNAMEGFRVFG